MFASTVFRSPASNPKNHQQQLKTHKEWVDYFLDADISASDKTERSEQYLNTLFSFSKIDLSQADWLDQPKQVGDYLMQQHHAVCEKFQDYLARRKNKTAREYFPSVAHAFQFLSQVAPVKLVDGSWLYSALQNYTDSTHRDLIHIYLEELGLGHARANHVTMYQVLLRDYELQSFIEQLDDPYYEQAAVQLALAYTPPEWLPLVIGFNLGYEQLPLHLLITNYELSELGINAHYFNVHITIDNAHNGHAQKSLKAFIDQYAQADDPERYLELVKYGYLMNDLGLSSTQIIQSLDIDQFALQVFQNKAIIGQYIHNQKCQFTGMSINEWLSNPNQIQDFLNVMIEKGWILKGRPAEESRFWSLIDHADGKMFGVFNATEKQIIKDWIQGAHLHKRLDRIEEHNNEGIDSLKHDNVMTTLKHHYQQCESLDQKVQYLIPYLAPHQHHSRIGLWATVQISHLLFPFQTQAMRFHTAKNRV